LRLRAAAGALFPPRGEEKKSEFEAECHLRHSLSSVPHEEREPASSSPMRAVLEIKDLAIQMAGSGRR
jgi:hypothetical protein